MKRAFLIFLPLFALLVGQSCCEETLKMIRVFGWVGKETLTGDNVDEDCEQTCFNRDDCFLAFYNEQDYCMLPDFNGTQLLNVVETTLNDGQYVSFKTTLPDDICPSNYSNSIVVNIGEDPIFWVNKLTTKILDYQTQTRWEFKKCVGDWKMFKRSNEDGEITVCIQVFPLSVATSKADAVQFCKDLNYTVTGVATPEETQWIYNKMKPFVEDGEGFWIDGSRACSIMSANGPPQLSNCPNIGWTDGYTEGNAAFTAGNVQRSNPAMTNCLMVADGILKDVACDVDDPAVGHGVVCGYKMEETY